MNPEVLTNFKAALEVTGLGMGLVFLTLILIMVVITVLDKLFKAAPEEEGDAAGGALAPAVAVAAPAAPAADNPDEAAAIALIRRCEIQ